MQFTINPNLNLDEANQEYVKDNRINLVNFLDVEQANELSEYMQKRVSYDQAYFVDNQYHQTAYEKLKQLNMEQRRELMTKVYQQARDGVGFWYGRQRIRYDSGDISDQFFEWLNDDSTLQAIRMLSGISTIKSATAQLTRYLPGDFLTRHNDVVEKEKRRIAFAYYLSPQWHPDWGGLLQFYKLNGMPRDSWAPFFNSISLFDVNHVHAVTSVATFAPTSRYAISGWFLDE
ncbi:proline hydroxylase [Aliikangiella marina]|uniref:Proline hydroxylase n=1 Tax=Aliikangiella marina TaxID=1712262 RepID=A0A545TD71_9GAMM|nr:2OG-Fe(II) oxygenase family protein [Aliikangiella marina]TQV75126.1 proline hydroxylase [Aliikangiella marina]